MNIPGKRKEVVLNHYKVNVKEKWRYFSEEQIIRGWKRGKWVNHILVLFPLNKKIKVSKDDLILITSRGEEDAKSCL